MASDTEHPFTGLWAFCMFHYKWNLINKTSKQNTTRDIEINNKLTVTREVGGERDNRGRAIKEHV